MEGVKEEPVILNLRYQHFQKPRDGSLKLKFVQVNPYWLEPLLSVEDEKLMVELFENVPSLYDVLNAVQIANLEKEGLSTLLPDIVKYLDSTEGLLSKIDLLESKELIKVKEFARVPIYSITAGGVLLLEKADKYLEDIKSYSK